MSEQRKRVVIVYDGNKWHVRRLFLSEHAMSDDHMVYRCDKPIANDLSLTAAVRAAKQYLRLAPEGKTGG